MKVLIRNSPDAKRDYLLIKLSAQREYTLTH